MRILMFTNSYIDQTRGGVEFHVANLAKALVELGHEVTVMRTSYGEGVHDPGAVPFSAPFAQHRASDGVRSHRLAKMPLVRFAMNFWSRYQTGRRVGRYALSHRDEFADYDLFHHHDFITSAILARHLRRFGTPQVWTNHLGEFLMIRALPLVGTRLTRWLTRDFDRAIGPSTELAEQEAVACPIRYIPNGVDTRTFVPCTDPSTLRGRYGIGEREVVCVVPRRWAPSKGVVYAARALASDRWPSECRVLFVGAGESVYPEYASEVRAELTRARGLFDVWDSVAPEEMAELLQVSDMCLIPSLLEATSLSALEAMASGLPVLAADTGGLPLVVTEGENGSLFPPADALAIARIVESFVMRSQADRASMGARGRARVLQEYSWTAVARRTEAFLIGNGA